ncbi:MAG: translation initiation factor IF-2 associated domain-containing protein, partial [Haemophilus seminalis]
MTEDVKADAPKKLSIQRRTKTTVSSTTTGGKSKEVQVEVRKKRTVKTDIAQQEEAKLKAQQEAEAKKIAEQKAAEEKARLEAEKAAAKKEADEHPRGGHRSDPPACEDHHAPE